MVKKQKAVGHESANAQVGEEGIDRILASRGEQNTVRPGFGRLVTTIGTLDEIERHLDDGWCILWCQMSKIVSGEGERNDG